MEGGSELESKYQKLLKAYAEVQRCFPAASCAHTAGGDAEEALSVEKPPRRKRQRKRTNTGARLSLSLFVRSRFPPSSLYIAALQSDAHSESTAEPPCCRAPSTLCCFSWACGAATFHSSPELSLFPVLRHSVSDTRLCHLPVLLSLLPACVFLALASVALARSCSKPPLACALSCAVPHHFPRLPLSQLKTKNSVLKKAVLEHQQAGAGAGAGKAEDAQKADNAAVMEKKMARMQALLHEKDQRLRDATQELDTASFRNQQVGTAGKRATRCCRASR